MTDCEIRGNMPKKLKIDITKESIQKQDEKYDECGDPEPDEYHPEITNLSWSEEMMGWTN